MKENKGITLIALVIMIVVLIILAGITVATISGENGLITKAQEAKEATERATVEEQLRLAQLAAKTKSQGGKITVDQVIDELKKQGVKVEKEDEETIVINDKYVYEITEEEGDVKWEEAGTVGKVKPKIESVEIIDRKSTSIKVEVTTKRNEGGTLKYYIKEEDKEYTLEAEQTDGEYTFIIDPTKTYTHIKVEAIGENGEVTFKEIDLLNVPSLKIGDVTFTYRVNGREISESQWTQGPETVEVSLVDRKLKDYTLQYTTQDPTIESNWKPYKTEIEYREKGKLSVRLYDTNLKEVGGRYTKEIANLDTKAPEISNIETTQTTNSITITAQITDPDSGVARCFYSKDNGENWEPASGTTDTSYTFHGLAQNHTYQLKIRTVDKVGNEAVTTQEISKKTENMPTATDSITDGKIKISYSETEPTKEDVTIKIETTELGEDYTIQYAIGDPNDENNWKDYKDTKPITMTENGEVHVRIKDKTGQTGDHATININNIDKLPPIAFTESTLTSTYTWSTITVKADTRDQAKTATNMCSGMEGYRFKLGNGQWSDWQKGETVSYTFEKVQPDTEYTIYVEAKDKVGNVTNGTIKTTIHDTTAPVINQFNVTSTSRSITIDATVVEEESGIQKCEYSKDGGTTWVTPKPADSTNYTFDDLDQNTTFAIQMKVTDKAGNVSEIKTTSKQTVGVPTLAKSNITLTPTVTTPTEGPVKVTIQNTSGNHYTIQYTTKDPEIESNWEDYTTGTEIPFEQNGVIYARLWDGKNAGTYATVNITNIDKKAPNTFTKETLTATSTKNSITVTANTTDPVEDDGYPGSGIAGYCFSKDGGANWTSWQASGTYTFSGLSTGSYTILVKAKDKAGHEIEGSIAKEVVDLSLSANNGKVLSGNSVNVTVNGGNYGDLSCLSSDDSIATATLSGTTLTVRGTSTANGTQTATITVIGSKGGSATYTIQSHKHYGSSSSGGGCYGDRRTNNVYCSGSRTIGISCGGSITGRTCGGSIQANLGACNNSISYSSPNISTNKTNMTCYATITGTCSVHGTVSTWTSPTISYSSSNTPGVALSTVIASYTSSRPTNCSRQVTKSYSCKTCGTTYSSTGTCSKITGYVCNRCNASYSSPGTCSRTTSYRCNSCNSTGSYGSCGAYLRTETTYHMNCGF